MANDDLLHAPSLLAPIARIYTKRLEQYGPCAKGVLWSTTDGQQLRFEILASLLDDEKDPITVNDLGCGYGALFPVLLSLKEPKITRYWGYDISEEMVIAAKEQNPDLRANFVQSLVASHRADYSFVSGTYNFKGRHDDKSWEDYIKASLKQLWQVSLKGMAFNLLDIKNADPEGGLYYADPDVFMNFCRENFSDNLRLDVSGVKDWTIFVRRA